MSLSPNLILNSTATPGLTYFLADHLGSTSISTDSTGAKTAGLRYTPWGEVRSSSGTMPTDYTFTAQRSEMDAIPTSHACHECQKAPQND